MNTSATTNTLRLKPGIIIVALQWMIWFLLPILIPFDIAVQIAFIGGIFGGLVLAIWWGFFSRAPIIERPGAIILMILGLYATSFLLHESIATSMMGWMYIAYSVPIMCLLFVLWASFTTNMSVAQRRLYMILTIFFASAIWIFIRTDGIDGSGRQDLAWRWAETHEERLLEDTNEIFSEAFPDLLSGDLKDSWSGFRGPERDGIVRGLKINTNWADTPPVEIWRRPVGPGCSSCSTLGNLLFTQEQRGDFETVSCYNLISGEPVWRYEDSIRFYDSHAGAGPRSTPTISDGRVYTLGATGILNVLDAIDGSLIWSRNAASDTDVDILTWGFTSSPLVVEEAVIIALSGRLAAYDRKNGDPLWFGPDGGNSYSSPHFFRIDDIPQVLLMSKAGTISMEPATGNLLWNYSWPMEDRILQPAMIEEGEFIFAADYKSLRRISISQIGNNWHLEERWTSSDCKFDFNDFAVHKGFAYGFDGPSLICVDLHDGKLLWKGDRYRGWLLLLADQDLLLILSERGELVLVQANPDQFTELSSFQAINGKTWNHPALANDILVVRNAREMAAFKLPILNVYE